MGKTLKIYIVFLILLICGITFLDAIAPKPINWSPTYDLKDKIPFGLYVFDQESPALFKNRKIEKVNVTAYEFLKNDKFAKIEAHQNLAQGTILKIDEFITIDKNSIFTIFDFVGKGNNLFLSSKEFPKVLLDSLKLKLKPEYNFLDSTSIWLANKKIGSQKYKITEGLGNNYFSKIDTLKTTVLGYQNGDSTRVSILVS